MMKRMASLIQSFAYWIGRRSMQSRLVLCLYFDFADSEHDRVELFFKQIRDTYISDALNQNSFLLEIEKMNMLNQIEAIEMAAQLAISDDGIKDYLRINEEPEVAWLIDLAQGPFKDIQRIPNQQSEYYSPSVIHKQRKRDGNVANYFSGETDRKRAVVP